jgi:hypothetical protein
LRGGPIPKQRLNFREETRVFAACVVKKRISLALGQLRGGVVKLLNFLPPLQLHGDAS